MGEDAGGLPLSTIGLITGGVGIVGIGVGGFFGLRAMSLGDESDSGCNSSNVCTDSGYSKRTDAIGAATVSTVAFVAGGVLTAAGVTLFIVGDDDDAEADSASVQASPAVGPGVAAMTVSGRF